MSSPPSSGPTRASAACPRSCSSGCSTVGRGSRRGARDRFAVARGPWNIAAFLMGTTEFMMALVTDREKVHALLKTVTAFLVDWIQVQARAFPSIEGIFILDDIVGFVGEKDLSSPPAVPQAGVRGHRRPRAVLHNDASGLVCARHLREIGVNLFNFSCDHPMTQMRGLVGDTVTLLGNIPPRDVLARARPSRCTTPSAACGPKSATVVAPSSPAAAACPPASPPPTSKPSSTPPAAPAPPDLAALPRGLPHPRACEKSAARVGVCPVELLGTEPTQRRRKPPCGWRLESKGRLRDREQAREILSRVGSHLLVDRWPSLRSRAYLESNDRRI